jgi:hypothetical protein
MGCLCSEIIRWSCLTHGGSFTQKLSGEFDRFDKGFYIWTFPPLLTMNQLDGLDGFLKLSVIEILGGTWMKPEKIYDLYLLTGSLTQIH